MKWSTPRLSPPLFYLHENKSIMINNSSWFRVTHLNIFFCYLLPLKSNVNIRCNFHFSRRLVSPWHVLRNMIVCVFFWFLFKSCGVKSVKDLGAVIHFDFIDDGDVVVHPYRARRGYLTSFVMFWRIFKKKKSSNRTYNGVPGAF